MAKDPLTILDDLLAAELLARDGLEAETIRKHLGCLAGEWEPVREQFERIIGTGNVHHKVAVAAAMTKAALSGNVAALNT
jgi:hypothetical protein